MNIYKLSYWTYENGSTNVLLHKNEYTKEGFGEIVANAINDLKEFMDENYVDSFDGIYSELIDKLISDYGFIKQDAMIELNPFGWEKLFNDDEWELKNDDVSLIKKYLNKK